MKIATIMILLTVFLILFVSPSWGIISGTTITPHSMPYMVGLKIKATSGSRILCGGTLVSPTYILTAASCTKNTSSIEVVLGAHYINKSESTQVRIVLNPTSFIAHPNFNEKTYENDIALLKLPKPVALNTNVNIITVANEKDIASFNLSAVWSISAGWGMTSTYRPSYSPYLISLWTNVVVDKYSGNCRYWFGDKIKDTNICCSSSSFVSICEGDMGGPLIVHTKKLLIGIASFTQVSCMTGAPSVFTNVAKYTAWIAANSDVDSLN